MPAAAPAYSLEDPREAAQSAGLVYVCVDQPGIARRRSGGGFSYRDAQGRIVRDSKTLERIRGLVIPPAWRDVWICARANGHLQAAGYDQRGRRQYRYHPKFRAVREEAKFEHILTFAQSLPTVRERVRRDMAASGLGRDKVLATVVYLLEATMIRIGGTEYARENNSFGLATLRSRHLAIEGANLRFHFRGKSGKDWRVGVHDRRVAKILKACQDLPGQHLFQYLDGAGEHRSVTSDDVNAYLKQASGADITAKDLRTWWGTVQAACTLSSPTAPASEAEAKQVLAQAIGEVSARLGNTPTICRKCYVHPEIITAHLCGELNLGADAALEVEGPGLSRAEQAVLALLRRRLGKTPIRTR